MEEMIMIMEDDHHLIPRVYNKMVIKERQLFLKGSIQATGVLLFHRFHNINLPCSYIMVVEDRGILTIKTADKVID